MKQTQQIYESQKRAALSIVDLVRIHRIFKEKGWPVQDSFEDNVFENFCCLLAELEPEERDLMLKITNNFLWIREGEYVKCFSEVFQKFVDQRSFNRGKRIFLCPLLSESDFGLTKSSVAVIYLVKAHMYAIQNKYKKQGLKIGYANPKDLLEDKFIDTIKRDGGVFCLIDDFIGTGNSAESAIDYFLEKGINPNEIVILSLTIMEEAIDRLNAKGVDVYFKELCKKGISIYEDTSQVDADTMRKIMKKIESKINVKDKDRFGYAASEALVRMIRTPNNTFPIYWLWNKKNNRFAPFRR